MSCILHAPALLPPPRRRPSWPVEPLFFAAFRLFIELFFQTPDLLCHVGRCLLVGRVPHVRVKIAVCLILWWLKRSGQLA